MSGPLHAATSHGSSSSNTTSATAAATASAAAAKPKPGLARRLRLGSNAAANTNPSDDKKTRILALCAPASEYRAHLAAAAAASAPAAGGLTSLSEHSAAALAAPRLALYKLTGSRKGKLKAGRVWRLAELTKIDGKGQSAASGAAMAMTFSGKTVRWEAGVPAERAGLLWAVLQIRTNVMGAPVPTDGLKLLELQKVAESLPTGETPTPAGNPAFARVTSAPSGSVAGVSRPLRGRAGADVQSPKMAVAEDTVKKAGGAMKLVEDKGVVPNLDIPREGDPKAKAPKKKSGQSRAEAAKREFMLLDKKMNRPEHEEKSLGAIASTIEVELEDEEFVFLNDEELEDLEETLADCSLLTDPTSGLDFYELLSNDSRMLEKANLKEIVNSEHDTAQVERAIETLSSNLLNAEDWLLECNRQLSRCAGDVAVVEALLEQIGVEAENSKKLYQTMLEFLEAVCLSDFEQFAISHCMGKTGQNYLKSNKFWKETVIPAMTRFEGKMNFKAEYETVPQMLLFSQSRGALMDIRSRWVAALFIPLKNRVLQCVSEPLEGAAYQNKRLLGAALPPFIKMDESRGNELVELYVVKSQEAMKAQTENRIKTFSQVITTNIASVFTSLSSLITQESLSAHFIFCPLAEGLGVERNALIHDRILRSEFSSLKSCFDRGIEQALHKKPPLEFCSTSFKGLIELLCRKHLYRRELDLRRIHACAPNLALPPDVADFDVYYFVRELIDELLCEMESSQNKYPDTFITAMTQAASEGKADPFLESVKFLVDTLVNCAETTAKKLRLQKSGASELKEAEVHFETVVDETIAKELTSYTNSYCNDIIRVIMDGLSKFSNTRRNVLLIKIQTYNYIIASVSERKLDSLKALHHKCTKELKGLVTELYTSLLTTGFADLFDLPSRTEPFDITEELKKRGTPEECALTLHDKIIDGICMHGKKNCFPTLWDGLKVFVRERFEELSSKFADKRMQAEETAVWNFKTKLTTAMEKFSASTRVSFSSLRK